MADAVTALIGAVVMIGYLYMIASKLDELPLWIACIIGVALMLWSIWIDAIKPLFSPRSG